jgi:Skp family chaperone for outer membrane proteins
MTRPVLGASVAILATAVAAGGAHAQARGRAATPARAAAAPAAAAAAPAGPPVTHGPPLAGVCVFSRQAAIGGSSAGKAAAARMEQLAQVVRAEIQPRETALQNDAKTFQTQRATLSADARSKQEQALGQRAEELQTLGATRRRQLELTQAKAVGNITNKLAPITQTVYQSKNCSILFNSDDAVFVANPAMDLTPQVIQQLNTQLPTLTFDLEPAPAQAAR